jgi:hypothetical protein
LSGIRWTRKQDFRTRSTRRTNEYPTFALLWDVRVFYEDEAELPDEELQSFVVVSDDERDMQYRLIHPYPQNRASRNRRRIQ